MYLFLSVLVVTFIGLWNYSIPKTDSIDMSHFNQDIRDFDNVPTF